MSAVPYHYESTQSSNQVLPKSAFRVCRTWPLTELRGLLSSDEAAEFGVYCCYLLQLFFVSLVQNAQTRELHVSALAKKRASSGRKAWFGTRRGSLANSRHSTSHNVAKSNADLSPASRNAVKTR